MDGKLGFTLTCDIQNYSCEKKGDPIVFATPELTALHGTKWSLKLYPETISENHIALFLQRECTGNGPESLFLECEFSILGVDDSPLYSRRWEDVFEPGKSRGLNKFITREELFGIKRHLYLPADLLTIRCRTWFQCEGNAALQHYTRTLLPVAKQSYYWFVSGLSSVSLVKNHYDALVFEDPECPEMILKFSLICNNRGKKIHLAITPIGTPRVNFVTIEMSGVSSKGRSTLKAHGRFTEKENEIWHVPELQLSFQEKIGFSGIKAGTLLLCCAFSLSFRPYREIDPEPIHAIAHPTVKGREKIRAKTSSEDVEWRLASTAVSQNLYRFWTDKIMTDVVLQVEEEKFDVHKLILSAQSERFEAIFKRQSEIKDEFFDCQDASLIFGAEEEIDSNTVVIPNSDAATVRRMLIFMYGGTTDELDWDSVIKLYRLAYAYSVHPLVYHCSYFLKSNISPISVCDVLSLADDHHDVGLRAFVEDFIVQRDTEVFNSKEWKGFIKTHSKLAAEAMLLTYTKIDKAGL